jgi:hypothetical protein
MFFIFIIFRGIFSEVFWSDFLSRDLRSFFIPSMGLGARMSLNHLHPTLE